MRSYIQKKAIQWIRYNSFIIKVTSAGETIETQKRSMKNYSVKNWEPLPFS